MSDKRSPGTAGVSLGGYPIARAFALVVLAALAALVLVRVLTGRIEIEVGTA